MRAPSQNTRATAASTVASHLLLIPLSGGSSLTTGRSGVRSPVERGGLRGLRGLTPGPLKSSGSAARPSLSAKEDWEVPRLEGCERFSAGSSPSASAGGGGT